MAEEQIYLVYRNRFNEVKTYKVVPVKVTDNHLQAIDLNAGYTKTFRKSRIIQTCKTGDAANRRAIIEQHNFEPILRPEANTSPQNSSKSVNLHNKTEVCFTGFKKKERTRLVQIASEKGFFVRKSISKNLALLVCGENAGPSKIQTARALNVAIVEGIDGFLHFLETGEIQE